MQYYLQKNPITSDPNDHSARVVVPNNLDLESIIKEMQKRNSSLTRSDILSSLALFFEVTTDEVAEGNTVSLPIAVFRPSIRGVFKDATDVYDEKRHEKRASVSQGTLMASKMKNAPVEKVTEPLPQPAPLHFEDVVTDTINSKVTPGGIGIIKGEELKFDQANEQEGIFFVGNDSEGTFKVSVLAKVTSGTLIFSIPTDLAAGDYEVEVRKNYASGNKLVSGRLYETLSVS